MFAMSKPRIPNPEDWMSTAQAADAIGVSSRTIYRWVEAGRLAPYTVGETMMFWRPRVLECAHAAALVRELYAGLAQGPRDHPDRLKPK